MFNGKHLSNSKILSEFVNLFGKFLSILVKFYDFFRNFKK